MRPGPSAAITVATTQVAPGYEWLQDCAMNDYSQSGEDGVLRAIFSVIRPANRWCCECGAADGLFFSNTRRLLERGWRGVLIEADERLFARLQTNVAEFGERVRIEHAMVSRDRRLEAILHEHGAPTDLDLMVIDVDGQEFYLWNSLLDYRPRVVVIEVGAWTDPDFCPAIGAPGQAGPGPICRLASGKLYDPVWSSPWNMVFVRRPLSRLLFGSREEMLKAHCPDE